jgi:hypothetical protein
MSMTLIVLRTRKGQGRNKEVPKGENEFMLQIEVKDMHPSTQITSVHPIRQQVKEEVTFVKIAAYLWFALLLRSSSNSITCFLVTKNAMGEV